MQLHSDIPWDYIGNLVCNIRTLWWYNNLYLITINQRFKETKIPTLMDSIIFSNCKLQHTHPVLHNPNMYSLVNINLGIHVKWKLYSNFIYYYQGLCTAFYKFDL